MIEIYVDGATSGNPGPSGAGIYIKTGSKSYEYAVSLSEMSNHEAEFQAVIKALHICVDEFPGEILSFRTDSKIVASAIENSYVKNTLFKSLLIEITKLSTHFPYVFIKWIPSKENYHADRLAKLVIHKNPVHED